MKFLKSISLLLFTLLVIAGCSGDSGKASGAETTETAATGVSLESLMAATPAASRVEVIDFYGTHRCVTCKAIEANTRYALATYFSEELKSGKITFRTVNVDDEANAALAGAYEATGTALFLNVVKDGVETHVDLTEQAFEKGRERDAFAEELKFFVNLHLQEI